MASKCRYALSIFRDTSTHNCWQANLVIPMKDSLFSYNDSCPTLAVTVSYTCLKFCNQQPAGAVSHSAHHIHSIQTSPNTQRLVFVKCFIECRHLEYCKTCIICRFKKRASHIVLTVRCVRLGIHDGD